MSDNYPSDVKLNENPNGTVSFATEVVATIAGLAATEVDGVASMVSPSSGLADMFTRKSNRSLTKGVRIDLEENRVSVDVTITVDYGSPIPDVAKNIQENVKKAIETMSGLDVKKVDVHVTGISFEREQRANAELDEQHRKMLEKNAEAEAQSFPEEHGEGETEAAVLFAGDVPGHDDVLADDANEALALDADDDLDEAEDFDEAEDGDLEDEEAEDDEDYDDEDYEEEPDYDDLEDDGDIGDDAEEEDEIEEKPAD